MKKTDEDELKKTIPNTPEEETLLSEITANQSDAEANRTDIERIWNDEYKSFKGDQWDLSFAKRAHKEKQVRPNSVDNFIFPSIMGMHSTLTATTPEATLEVNDGDDETDDTELERKVTDNVANIFDKNKFPALWKKIVLRGISHGPFIAAVLWDNDWIGGNGPNRWIGEVKIIAQKKDEIYFDPAIIDLEERMQECGFINRKFRKKLTYFVKAFPERGSMVKADGGEDEGANHKQAWLREAWHKGKPKFMPPERKKELLEKAQRWMPPAAIVDEYKAELYQQMAVGKVDGVHVSYSTTDVFLEYVPYAYEDGLYPFIFKVMYTDEKCPYGFGEIRNAMIPQVMHNKSDEIEIEAMSVEGLGGYFYEEGAISPKQLAFLSQNNYKGGIFAEVNSLPRIKPREGAKVPANIAAYKEHKQRMVETISKNTPIRQGMAPSGNLPYAAIAELGARTDNTTKGIAETLEDFMEELVLMITSRMKEFYTEERAYKVRENQDNFTDVVRQLKEIAQMPDEQQKVLAVYELLNTMGTNQSSKYGKFSNQEMTKSWVRKEAVTDPITEEVIEPEKMETYMPDFAAKVKIMDERPTDRNYYIELAMNLLPLQMLDMESFWYVIEEGKFPPKETIIERLQKQMQAQAAQANPAMAAMVEPQQTEPMQTQEDGELDTFLASLTPEEAEALQNDEELQNEVVRGFVK
jgi:hypothetical protein